MPWVRFDDQFTIHRKVKGLSDPAYRLHTEAIFWCARNLTDGFVSAGDLPDLATARRPLKFLPELVARGNWHEAAEVCDSKKCPAHVGNRPASVDEGWLIHDYFEYQPTKAKVLEERANNAVRQRRHRDRHKGEPESRSERNAVSNAVTNGRSNTTPSRPVPSRRDVDGTGSQSSSRRNARGDVDDDSIDLAIVQLLAERTGVDVSALWATKVRQQILAGHDVRNRLAYIATSISERPHDFLPPADTIERPPLRAAPEWCGHCDPRTRQLELADDTAARCPACHPLARNQEAS